MSNTITNEQLVAEQGLLTFFLVQSEDEQYNEFRSFYDGIVDMVAHKHFGWVETITESGYEQIVEAYNALYSTGFFDDDSEIYG
jgi:hypothetical protein